MPRTHVERDCVGVIDDDDAVRGAIRRLLSALRIHVHAYASAREYLDDAQGRECCACLVLDVRMPGMSGLELQKQLRAEKRMPAIVFVSGHADVGTAVEAMRNGAVDFLEKPFSERQLLDSVQRALAQERRTHLVDDRIDVVSARMARLTPRENEVLSFMRSGMRTKGIATHLGIAARTVEEHRAHVMQKMEAGTIGELIGICQVIQ